MRSSKSNAKWCHGEAEAWRVANACYIVDVPVSIEGILPQPPHVFFQFLSIFSLSLSLFLFACVAFLSKSSPGWDLSTLVGWWASDKKTLVGKTAQEHERKPFSVRTPSATNVVSSYPEHTDVFMEPWFICPPPTGRLITIENCSTLQSPTFKTTSGVKTFNFLIDNLLLSPDMTFFQNACIASSSLICS